MDRISVIVILFAIILTCTSHKNEPFNNVHGKYDLFFEISNEWVICKEAIKNEIFILKLTDTNYLSKKLDSAVEAYKDLCRTKKRDKIFEENVYIRTFSDVRIDDLIPVIRTIGEHGVGKRNQTILIDSQQITIDVDMFLVRGDYPNENGFVTGRPVLYFKRDSIICKYSDTEDSGLIGGKLKIKMHDNDSSYEATYLSEKVRNWYRNAVTVIPDSFTTIGSLCEFAKNNDENKVLFYRFFRDDDFKINDTRLQVKMSSSNIKKGSLKLFFDNNNKNQRDFKYELTDVLDKNIPSLRKIFREKFRVNKELQYCKISLSICVLQSGKIYEIEMLESTVNDSVFESKVIQNVLKWRFSKINKKIDTSCVHLPLVAGNEEYGR
jgi:hypothetical protein